MESYRMQIWMQSSFSIISRNGDSSLYKRELVIVACLPSLNQYSHDCEFN